MSGRRFPIMGTHGQRTGHVEGGSIAWATIAPHEKQALRNHYQSLEVLASRGGLSWTEALAVLLDVPYSDVEAEYRGVEQREARASARTRVLAIDEAGAS